MLADARKRKATTQVRDAASSALEGGLKAGVGELVKPILSGLISGALAAGLSSGAAAAIASIVASWFRRVESVTEQIKAVESSLEVLLSQHLHTGLRRARKAYELAAFDDHQRAVRDGHLGFAIEELERAWTITKDRGLPGELLFMIRLVQGLCEIRRQGGCYAAAQFFHDCRMSLAQRSTVLAEEIRQAQSQVERTTQHLEHEEREAQRRPEYRDNPHYRRSQLRNPIAPHRHLPDGYVPEPEMIQTFDPIPHALAAADLRRRRELQVQIEAALQAESARIEELDQLLTHLPQIDLAGPEGMTLGEVFS
jgi:hypothetical protein